MGPGEFVFIQEMGTGSHRPKTKSLIKMHVMDRVVMKRQARKEESCHGRDYTAESSPEAQSSSIDRYIEQNGLRPMAGVDDMILFSGLPIEVNTQTKILLHHFLNYTSTSKTLCTVTAETGWLKYAIGDSALFNSTLYHWAFLNYNFLPASFQSQQILLALKAAAIRRLASQFQQATPDFGSDPPTFSDATIATVACLANANFLCGDVEEAKVHFQGLRGMVRSRKGVLNLGFQGLASRIVRWTDCCHAQLSNMTLSFDEENFETAQFSSSLLDSQSLYDQPSNWVMLDELRSISKELVATPKHLMAPDRRAALGFRLLASDRSILKCIHGEHSPDILALLARGALLFSHTVLRGASRTSRIIRTLVDQLKQAIIFVYTSEGDIFADQPIALVWLLLIGMLASGGENIQRAWFRLCLEKACGSDTELSWEDVQALTETPNNISPQPFCWMLEEVTLGLPRIRTSILC